MKSIVNLISNLSQLGVNVTELQVQTLKWRLSKEGKDHYSRKETNEFYKAIKKGKTDLIDIVRKEKQEIIEKLKKELEKS